jgi:hypothetical protein
MTVCFSTRASNADYLGFEASPEAIIAAAKKAAEWIEMRLAAFAGRAARLRGELV